MNKEELLTEDAIKKNVPKWVLSTGYTLLFLSVFINSIGLNLMQINSSLTDVIVARLDAKAEKMGEAGKGSVKDYNNNKNIKDIKVSLEDAVTKEDIALILKRLKELEAVSHAPASN